MAIYLSNTHFYISARPPFSVVSYCIDERGLLTEAGMVPLLGGRAQLSTDLQGATLYSVFYSGSCLNVSPIDEQSIIGAPRQTLEGLTQCHSGNVDTINQVLWDPARKKIASSAMRWRS